MNYKEELLNFIDLEIQDNSKLLLIWSNVIHQLTEKNKTLKNLRELIANDNNQQPIE